MNALVFDDMPKRVWFAVNNTTGETVFRNTRNSARQERTLMKNRGAKSVRIGYFDNPVIDSHA